MNIVPETIKLLCHEWSRYKSENTIKISSHYDLIPNKENERFTKADIESRLGKVLEANRWLTGFLATDEDESIVLKVPNTFNVSNHLQFITDDDLLECKSHIEFGNRSSVHYNLKNGVNALDKEEFLMKFYYIENTSRSKLSIVLAMNHVIADNWSHYKIWGMMNENGPIIGLRNTRDDTVWNIAKEKHFLSHIKDGIEELNNDEKPVMPQTESTPRFHMLKINLNTIKKYKEMYNTDEFFVSTNDILMSVIFGKEIYNADFVHMAVNLRLRIETLDENEAGNYLANAMFRTKELETPKSLRETFTAMLDGPTWRLGTSSNTSPLRKIRWNLATNWAHGYEQLEMKGYTHRVHAPLIIGVDMERMKFFGIALCPFKADKDTLAIAMGVNSDVSDEILHNHELFDGALTL